MTSGSSPGPRPERRGSAALHRHRKNDAWLHTGAPRSTCAPCCARPNRGTGPGCWPATSTRPQQPAAAPRRPSGAARALPERAAGRRPIPVQSRISRHKAIHRIQVIQRRPRCGMSVRYARDPGSVERPRHSVCRRGKDPVVLVSSSFARNLRGVRTGITATRYGGRSPMLRYRRAPRLCGDHPVDGQGSPRSDFPRVSGNRALQRCSRRIPESGG